MSEEISVANDSSFCAAPLTGDTTGQSSLRNAGSPQREENYQHESTIPKGRPKPTYCIKDEYSVEGLQAKEFLTSEAQREDQYRALQRRKIESVL